MSYSDMGLDLDDFDSDFEAGFEEGDSGTVFPEFDFESLGIDPATPTAAKPGSEEKVCMLAARYAAGLPLWHNDDCVDHGPDDEEDWAQRGFLTT